MNKISNEVKFMKELHTRKSIEERTEGAILKFPPKRDIQLLLCLNTKKLIGLMSKKLGQKNII